MSTKSTKSNKLTKAAKDAALALGLATASVMTEAGFALTLDAEGTPVLSVSINVDEICKADPAGPEIARLALKGAGITKDRKGMAVVEVGTLASILPDLGGAAKVRVQQAIDAALGRSGSKPRKARNTRRKGVPSTTTGSTGQVSGQARKGAKITRRDKLALALREYAAIYGGETPTEVGLQLVTKSDGGPGAPGALYNLSGALTRARGASGSMVAPWRQIREALNVPATVTMASDEAVETASRYLALRLANHEVDDDQIKAVIRDNGGSLQALLACRPGYTPESCLLDDEGCPLEGIEQIERPS